MTLRNVPVDVTRVGVFLCVSKEQKTDRDSGAQRANRDGVPLWTVGVAVRPVGYRASVIEVTVAGEPAVEVGQVLSFVNLEASLWEIEGRAGLAYRADSVAVAPAGGVPPVPEMPAADPRGSRGGAK